MTLSILSLHGLGGRKSGASVGADATAAAAPTTGITPLTIGLIAGTVGVVGGYFLLKKDRSSEDGIAVSKEGIPYESDPSDKDTYAGIQREAGRMRFDLSAGSLSFGDECSLSADEDSLSVDEDSLSVDEDSLSVDEDSLSVGEDSLSDED